MPVIIPSIIALGSAGYQAYTGSQQKKQGQRAFEKAMAERPQYQISDTVKAQLAEAQARYNAQNPAIAMAYQQAQQGMANQQANIQRNAGSGFSALAGGAAAQAQLQSIIPQLAAQQTAFQQQQQANLANSQALMAQEEKNRYSDMLAANQMKQNFGLGLAQAGSAMQSQGLSAGVQAAGNLASAGLSAQFAGNTPSATTTPGTPTVSNPSEFYNNASFNPAAAPNTTGLNTNAFNLQNKNPLVFGPQAFAPTNAPKLDIPALPGQMPSQLPVDNTANQNFIKKAFGQQPFSNTNPFPTPIYPNYGSVGPNPF
jgi:hypothetical protein